jgi:hypothetical protein
MPVFGNLDSDAAKGLPKVGKLAKTRVDIAEVETLTFTFEVGADGAHLALPKALHPPAPPYCSFTIRRHKDSPFGTFTLAELRLHSRATGLYMGYGLGAYADNKAAVKWLRAAYGAPVRHAEEVVLAKRHYGYEARVSVGGVVVLDALQEHPTFVNGADVLYIPTLNLADWDGGRWLIAEEFEYQTKEAKRGSAVFRVRDLAAFGAPTLAATNELPSTFTTGTWAYETVRYVLNPRVPARAGLKSIEGADAA